MIFAIILGIFAILLLALGLFFNKAKSNDLRRVKEYNEDPKNRERFGNPYSTEGPAVSDVMSGFWFIIASVALFITAFVFTLFAITFQVDTGEAKVLKSWTGVVNPDPVTDPGLHFKSPFEDTIAWDIKSKSVMFSGNGETTHEGQNVVGAEISFTDKDGIAANLDIQVVFSIKAKETVTLTSTYKDQSNFESTIVENDVKSLPRDVASTFTTVQMFEDRPRFRTEVTELLEKTWAEEGVIVDKVNIHGIRYPEDVQQRFKDAQNAKPTFLRPRRTRRQPRRVPMEKLRQLSLRQPVRQRQTAFSPHHSPLRFSSSAGLMPSESPAPSSFLRTSRRSAPCRSRLSNTQPSNT